MKQVFLTVRENERIAKDVYRMVFSGDFREDTRPGRFINIKLDHYYLRRPISVCDVTEEGLTIIYKVLGHGTADMTKIVPGSMLDTLIGLGNGFSTEASGDCPLLIAGGVGLPPMYLLAKTLIAEGKKPALTAGFNTAEDAFFLDEFRALGIDVRVATMDGSCGVKGFVTDALPEEYTYFYACGPMPMLKAVYKSTKTSGLFSLEERMGCGFGACMGCSIETANGPKRVCKDGPVFKKEDLLWME